MDQFRLEPDEQKRLRDKDDTIRTLRETIAKMKSIGLPVDDLEADLGRAVMTRDGLIREFGNPVMPR